MLPRLVAVDLDGTLLRSDLTLSERSRAAIRAMRERDVEVVVVTARAPRSVREIARAAGIGGLAVCANGALLFDLERDTIARHTPLGAATVARVVVEWRRIRPAITFGWEHELRFGSEPAYEALRDTVRWPRPEGSFPVVDASDWRRPVTKLLARAGGVDVETLLVEGRTVAADECTVTIAGSAFVELLAPGVSKEAALAVITTMRGIDPADVVAFGDQLADAGMLAWAGLGVAVANAHPTALAAADAVTRTNDEDGVAIVLERLLSTTT